MTGDSLNNKEYACCNVVVLNVLHFQVYLKGVSHNN